MEIQESLIDLEKLKKIRSEAPELEQQIDLVSRKKQRLMLELIRIQHACEHKIVVRYNDAQFGPITCCLNCNKTFYGMVVGFDFYFKNIIDLQSLNTECDKFEIALKLFEQARINNPNLNDSEIVKLINKQTEQKQSISEKTDFVKSIEKNSFDINVPLVKVE